jgi:CDP-diacylglycerol--glycerol-3-phosphate 3-phosphatidyltransferase
MAVVVVGRELLVTALRSFLEQQGADFSATLSGKLKMVLQCLAAAVSLYALSYGTLVRPQWLQTTLVISIWSAVALTVISGVAYVFAAIKLLRQ